MCHFLNQSLVTKDTAYATASTICNFSMINEKLWIFPVEKSICVCVCVCHEPVCSREERQSDIDRNCENRVIKNVARGEPVLRL